MLVSKEDSQRFVLCGRHRQIDTGRASCRALSSILDFVMYVFAFPLWLLPFASLPLPLASSVALFFVWLARKWHETLH